MNFDICFSSIEELRRGKEDLEVEEYLESIENEDVRKMMYNLRKIRGGGHVVSAEVKSDRELLIEAFSRMK